MKTTEQTPNIGTAIFRIKLVTTDLGSNRHFYGITAVTKCRTSLPMKYKSINLHNKEANLVISDYFIGMAWEKSIEEHYGFEGRIC